MFSRYLYSKVMEGINMESIKLILAPFEVNFLDSMGVKYNKVLDNNITYYVLNPKDLVSRFSY